MELLEREHELAAIEVLLAWGGVLFVEGGAGIGKTSLLQTAGARAAELGHEVLRARASELEAGFPFGVVRQLFERRLAAAEAGERDELLEGHAAAVRPLLLGGATGAEANDTSFAVLHGLYWLTANLADRGRSVLMMVDDAHWADDASLRWLAYLAPRIEGPAVALLVATRPAEPASSEPPLVTVRAQASALARPKLLTLDGVTRVVRLCLGAEASDGLCSALKRVSGGNPFYLRELLRSQRINGTQTNDLEVKPVPRGAGRELVQQVALRISALDPDALGFAQALAVLGDGCEFRHAAALAGLDLDTSLRLAAGLVRVDVLESLEPVRFLHPIVRSAVEASLGSADLDARHRAAARVLHDDGSSPGRVAAHLVRVIPAGDQWVLSRLCEAASAAIESGAPRTAADLLRRALAEPPPLSKRVPILRQAARAEAGVGRELGCVLLEEALQLTRDRRERAEISLEVAEAYASLFRWVDAVDVIERALAELGNADPGLAGRLEGELVVAGLHDARRAALVPAMLERLRKRAPSDTPAEALASASGMAAILGGRTAEEVAGPLEAVLAAAPPRTENWDTRAALLWTLVTAERFEAVEAALVPMLVEVRQCGSARGFVATYSTLGLMKLRLGALPDAEAAARVALSVIQEGDFAAGLPFAVTVLAEVAVEAGDLDGAQELLDLLPQDGWPAGVGTVLIPATRARLRLAQGRPADALGDFETCASMFSRELWGMDMQDVGYLHARSGAALALLRLGEPERARELAISELDDARYFGAPRALGIALRVAGLARGGVEGTELLSESATVLRDSPAALELARSLTELGGALRRAGKRAAAREPLVEALDLAARCGARPLAARARDELRATGARPRSELRRGVEALTPSEWRVARLAADGRTNREIAQELYVTLKTVEGHLARAYGKLGIAGRGELAESLEGEKTRVGTP